ncbi:Polyhomeotic-like protein 1 [Collichthys lucidus]|uniref:Polyhomeotic-like protein 1 n=1 Tax=Collichthys lucidus TaxID=240159 RepID=A0A4U5VK93_COLLU|nr:Polyhomeotic-like protein 1 [Collichthys lucidus]
MPSDFYFLNIFLLLLLHLSLCPLHAYGLYTAYGSKETKTVCVARLGFSTVYVTLCLRYSMYWFPRYNVSFRQHFCMRQGQSQAHAPDQDRGQGHLSNSDEEGGIARRRVPRRTSSEIASAKIAGRPIPVKCRSESSHSEEESSGEEDEDDPMSLSPASSASCHQPPPPPLPTESSAPGCLPASPGQWSVEEVSQFISSLQGCEELASQFLSQEIDGQALLLLKEEHLMSTMNIKLGPALKICAHINNLRD